MTAVSFRPDVFALEPARLIGMRCPECSAITFPRRNSCPACGAHETLEDRELSKNGELCSWSIVRNAPAGLRTPYILAYVDLPDDGVRVMSRLVDVEEDRLVVGMPLELSSVAVESTRTDGQDDKATDMFVFRPTREKKR